MRLKGPSRNQHWPNHHGLCLPPLTRGISPRFTYRLHPLHSPNIYVLLQKTSRPDQPTEPRTFRRTIPGIRTDDADAAAAATHRHPFYYFVRLSHHPTPGCHPAFDTFPREVAGSGSKKRRMGEIIDLSRVLQIVRVSRKPQARRNHFHETSDKTPRTTDPSLGRSFSGGRIRTRPEDKEKSTAPNRQCRQHHDRSLPPLP